MSRAESPDWAEGKPCPTSYRTWAEWRNAIVSSVYADAVGDATEDHHELTEGFHLTTTSGLRSIRYSAIYAYARVSVNGSLSNYMIELKKHHVGYCIESIVDRVISRLEANGYTVVDNSDEVTFHE